MSKNYKNKAKLEKVNQWIRFTVVSHYKTYALFTVYIYIYKYVYIYTYIYIYIYTCIYI